MEQLGTDLILICSNVSDQSLGGVNRAADDLRELGDLADERNLRIGYEALAWGRHVNDHRDAWEIVRRADHANVGLILDTFHTLARKIPVESIQAIPPDKIFSSRSPMRRSSTWTCCRGAGTSGTFPARARLRSTSSCRR